MCVHDVCLWMWRLADFVELFFSYLTWFWDQSRVTGPVRANDFTHWAVLLAGFVPLTKYALMKRLPEVKTWAWHPLPFRQNIVLTLALRVSLLWPKVTLTSGLILTSGRHHILLSILHVLASGPPPFRHFPLPALNPSPTQALSWVP